LTVLRGNIDEVAICVQVRGHFKIKSDDYNGNETNVVAKLTRFAFVVCLVAEWKEIQADKL
jgi:hypothetical protein